MTLHRRESPLLARPRPAPKAEPQYRSQFPQRGTAAIASRGNSLKLKFGRMLRGSLARLERVRSELALCPLARGPAAGLRPTIVACSAPENGLRV